MYVDVVRKWVLLDFLHFGVLSHTEKGTKWAYGVEYRFKYQCSIQLESNIPSIMSAIHFYM